MVLVKGRPKWDHMEGTHGMNLEIECVLERDVNDEQEPNPTGVMGLGWRDVWLQEMRQGEGCNASGRVVSLLHFLLDFHHGRC